MYPESVAWGTLRNFNSIFAFFLFNVIETFSVYIGLVYGLLTPSQSSNNSECVLQSTFFSLRFRFIVAIDCVGTFITSKWTHWQIKIDFCLFSLRSNEPFYTGMHILLMFVLLLSSTNVTCKWESTKKRRKIDLIFFSVEVIIVVTATEAKCVWNRRKKEVNKSNSRWKT